MNICSNRKYSEVLMVLVVGYLSFYNSMSFSQRLEPGDVYLEPFREIKVYRLATASECRLGKPGNLPPPPSHLQYQAGAEFQENFFENSELYMHGEWSDQYWVRNDLPGVCFAVNRHRFKGIYEGHDGYVYGSLDHWGVNPGDISVYTSDFERSWMLLSGDWEQFIGAQYPLLIRKDANVRVDVDKYGVAYVHRQYKYLGEYYCGEKYSKLNISARLSFGLEGHPNYSGSELPARISETCYANNIKFSFGDGAGLAKLEIYRNTTSGFERVGQLCPRGFGTAANVGVDASQCLPVKSLLGYGSALIDLKPVSASQEPIGYYRIKETKFDIPAFSVLVCNQRSYIYPSYLVFGDYSYWINGFFDENPESLEGIIFGSMPAEHTEIYRYAFDATEVLKRSHLHWFDPSSSRVPAIYIDTGSRCFSHEYSWNNSGTDDWD